MPDWYWATALLLGLMLGLMFIGMPAGLAMALTSAILVSVFLGPEHLVVLANTALDRATDYQFVVAPLFIFMAALVAYSGVAQEAFEAAARWMNRLPGSLALASTAGCALFAAVSGSSVATALTIGVFAIPQMLRAGYDRRLAVGSVATAGTLGILIPPSISMVIFGVITETSVGQLFIAGIVPGILLALVLMAYILVVCARHPELAPPSGHFTWRQRFEALGHVWGIIALFALVMGSMYFGIATPVEASAVGATGAFILMALKSQLTWPRFVDALRRSAETTAMVSLLLLGGFTLSFVAASMGIAHGLSRAITDSNLPPMAIILGYNLLLILLGTALETSTIIVITMPLLFPAFKTLGFDPLWLGVLTTINAEIGTISPPSGLVLFAVKGIAPSGFTTNDLYRAVLPFNILVGIFLLAMIMFPELSTWLPSLMRGA